MRLESLFGATHENRIHYALKNLLDNNDVIESSFCVQSEHYCQINRTQLPWSPIDRPKLVSLCKRLNCFIKEKLNINCGCFVIYKFFNSPHISLMNRVLKNRKINTYSLSLKQVMNEFPQLERMFVNVQNGDRFRASQMLVASFALRNSSSTTTTIPTITDDGTDAMTTTANKRRKIARLVCEPQLYIRPIIGGIVRKLSPKNHHHHWLELSLPIDISKFVFQDKIGHCSHDDDDDDDKVITVRSSDRSHDEGESFYKVCKQCKKTIVKLA